MPNKALIRNLWNCCPGDVVHAKVGDASICGDVAMVAIDDVGAFIVKVQWLDSGQHPAELWFPRDRVKLKV